MDLVTTPSKFELAKKAEAAKNRWLNFFHWHGLNEFKRLHDDLAGKRDNRKNNQDAIGYDLERIYFEVCGKIAEFKELSNSIDKDLFEHMQFTQQAFFDVAFPKNAEGLHQGYDRWTKQNCLFTFGTVNHLHTHPDGCVWGTVQHTTGVSKDYFEFGVTAEGESYLDSCD